MVTLFPIVPPHTQVRKGTCNAPPSQSCAALPLAASAASLMERRDECPKCELRVRIRKQIQNGTGKESRKCKYVNKVACCSDSAQHSDSWLMGYLVRLRQWYYQMIVAQSTLPVQFCPTHQSNPAVLPHPSTPPTISPARPTTSTAPPTSPSHTSIPPPTSLAPPTSPVHRVGGEVAAICADVQPRHGVTVAMQDTHQLVLPEVPHFDGIVKTSRHNLLRVVAESYSRHLIGMQENKSIIRGLCDTQ